MDKNLPQMGNDFIAVCQDFERDIHDAFESASDLLAKYDKMIVLFAAQSNHPPESKIKNTSSFYQFREGYWYNLFQ